MCVYYVLEFPELSKPKIGSQPWYNPSPIYWADQVKGFGRSLCTLTKKYEIPV